MVEAEGGAMWSGRDYEPRNVGSAKLDKVSDRFSPGPSGRSTALLMP